MTAVVQLTPGGLIDVVSRRKFRPALGVALIGALALSGWLLPSLASAATPSSLATCTGSLTPDSSGSSSGEPNLLDYSFSCSADITSYTFVVNRKADDSNVIDDFESSPTVIQNDGTPSATEGFICSGGIPGNGFNCDAATGVPMTTGYSAQGSLDPIDPYCKRLPPGAKPGTPAEPQAQVEVIVTETTGASDGPFVLDLATPCPTVPDTVPYPTPPKPKPTNSCSGTLSSDSSLPVREPNMLDYSFSCDGKVTAYSILVNRASRPTTSTRSRPARSWSCFPAARPVPARALPALAWCRASGFNCAAPVLDTDARLAHGSGNLQPGLPVLQAAADRGQARNSAEPQAVVQLLITDATGAERGPFKLRMKPACLAGAEPGSRAQGQAPSATRATAPAPN